MSLFGTLMEIETLPDIFSINLVFSRWVFWLDSSYKFATECLVQVHPLYVIYVKAI